MKRWCKRSVLALGTVAILAVAGRVVISQQPTGPPAPPPPPVAAYAQLFEQARPHLEAVLGVKLDDMRLSAATPPQVPRVPDPDLDAHLRWHFPHLQGDTLQSTRQIARQIAAGATVAQYAEGHRVIVVAADNLEKIAGWDPDLAAVKSPQFLQLALVYEAVRWHLDRRYDLATLRAGCRDGEEFDALLALVEGRALDVTSQVAARLRTEAFVPLLAERWLRVPDEAPDPSLRAASQTYLHGRQRAMIRGAEFFAALAPKGVPEEAVFEKRPRQLTVIARPSTWLEMQDQHKPDLAAVLGPLKSALPADGWQVHEQTWTPAMLGQVANLLGAPRERVEKVAATWYEGRTLVWIQRPVHVLAPSTAPALPEVQVALSVVRHDGPTGARAYFGFALDLQRKQDTLPAGTCGPAIRVLESKSAAARLDGFDEAVRFDKRIQLGGGTPVPVSLLLARAGDLVIECTWHGTTGADEAALAERLLQGVRSAAK